jgi:hypothetical protein
MLHTLPSPQSNSELDKKKLKNPSWLPEVVSRKKERRRDFAGIFISFIIGLLAAYWPYFLNHRFYFNDDEQTQHYPYFLEIGRQLHHGRLPFLTLATLNGGNLIIDWQYALFNPVSLLSYWLIAFLNDLTVIGLLLASLYIGLIASGGFILARSFGISRRLSIVAATVLCTNNFVVFVYSHSWMTCLVATSWFLWAWGFIQFYRSTGNILHLVGAIFFSFLVLSAGWPQTIIMQGILVFSYLIEMMLDIRFSRKLIISFALSMAGVFMLASPALLPAIFSRTWTCRGMSFSSHGLFMPNLGDFLNLSSFDLMPHMIVFISTLCAVPVMHLAWFIMPLLPLLRWSSVVKVLSHRWALGICGAIGLLLLFGPQSIGPIRWPIRFLPLVHPVLLIAFLLVINKSEVFVINKRRCQACAMLVLISLTSSISTSPRWLEFHLFSGCFLGFLVWMAIEFIRIKRIHALHLWMIMGVMVGYLGTHYSFINPFLPDFGSKATVDVSPRVESKFNGYTLCLSQDFQPNQENWSDEAFLGAQGIFSDKYTINGYTSIGHRTFGDKFNCGGRTEITSSHDITNLFAIDTTTGFPTYGLLRINRLIIEHETALPIVRSFLGSSWKVTSNGKFTTCYERIDPDLSSSTIAWATPGTATVPINQPTGEMESLQVQAAQTGSNLVFARLWWPGYAATLNGIPVVTKPFNDFLVMVQLASGSHGTLLLTYQPVGYRLGLVLAFFGVVMVILALLLSGKVENGLRSHDVS